MSGRSNEEFEADRLFEQDVLRVARLLYPSAPGGAEMVDGQERDGVLIGREAVVAIEATRSRKIEKVEKDARKLNLLLTKLSKSHPTKLIRGFIVTAEEPTADQRERTKKLGSPFVSIVGMAQFRKQLFDAMEYLAARDVYAFGSARDLLTNDIQVSTDFVPMELLSKSNLAEGWPIKDLAGKLEAGGVVVLTGEFGVGKSMTLRELYKAMASRFRRNPSGCVPIHLNLRDHRGQDDPTEALHRHARLIGFPRPDEIVRAWRSGQTTLLLDGFDEITYPGWSGRVSTLADVRRANVAFIRRLVSESPGDTGIILAGRSHFFDSEQEMYGALGLRGDTLHLSASDFTPDQVTRFLRANGLDVVVPEWLPTRPLLLGYLAHSGFLGDTGANDAVGPAEGWDLLLSKTSDREAQMEVGVDGPAVRRILERAATRARRTSNGRGPLRFDELTTAFRQVCGYEPDEGSRVILDRLPGLGIALGSEHQQADLPREFVDDDFADAARAGDIFEFVRSPFAYQLASEDVRQWQSLLDDVGLQLAWHRMQESELTQTAVQVALDYADSHFNDSGLVCDLLRLLAWLGASKRERAPFLSQHVIPSLHLQRTSDFTGIKFSGCLIERLEVELTSADWASMPTFQDVHFETVEGVSGEAEMPTSNFQDCTFGTFSESAENTSDILSLAIEDEAKVVLVLLRKLYKQRGSGRKDSALRRGALSQHQQELVTPALERLQSEGLVAEAKVGGQKVWLPVAASRHRALDLLERPLTTTDAVLRGQ